MEEKERYELRIYAGCESYSITDTKEKQQITLENVINLLNKQDKRIKELQQENLSLQEQSIRDNQNWIEETTKLKQQLHDLPKNCLLNKKKNMMSNWKSKQKFIINTLEKNTKTKTKSRSELTSWRN